MNPQSGRNFLVHCLCWCKTAVSVKKHRQKMVHLSGSSWDPVIISLVAATLLLCLTSIVRHMIHFHVSELQCCYGRFFICISVFAMCCGWAYFSPYREYSLEVIESIVESYVVILFFHLAVRFIGGEQVVRAHYRCLAACDQPDARESGCSSRISRYLFGLIHRHSDRVFVYQRRLTWQMLLIRPLLAIVVEALEDKYTETHSDPSSSTNTAVTLCRLVSIISLATAINGVATLYLCLKLNLPPLYQRHYQNTAASLSELGSSSSSSSSPPSPIHTPPSESIPASHTTSSLSKSPVADFVSLCRLPSKFIIVKLLVAITTLVNGVCSFLLSSNFIAADQPDYNEMATGARLAACVSVIQVFFFTCAVCWLFSSNDVVLQEIEVCRREKLASRILNTYFAFTNSTHTTAANAGTTPLVIDVCPSGSTSDATGRRSTPIAPASTPCTPYACAANTLSTNGVAAVNASNDFSYDAAASFATPATLWSAMKAFIDMLKLWDIFVLPK